MKEEKDKESDRIKDYLFEYIKNSKTIPGLIAGKKFDQVITDVTNNCYDQILSMGKKDKVVRVLATVLLHYLLTSALITSQRKVQYKGKDLDIVIPDTKTLEKDPKKSLLICIAESSDVEKTREQVAALDEIQPEGGNIWLVSSKEIKVAKRTFVLDKESNSFSRIIFEIAEFSNVGGSNKFKILRI